MNINKIKLSGTTYNIQDENATKTVELTQTQYDALSTKDPNTFYIITDAQGADLSNYYTKSETSGATEISTALNVKADTATTYTKTEVDNAITAATSTKQDTLVSGTNIKTINNESILGSGNIDIQGGGDVTVDPSLDSGSTNPVANSAITNTVGKYYYAFKIGNSPYVSPWGSIYSNNCVGTTLTFKNIITDAGVSCPLWLSKINGKSIFYGEYTVPNANNFNFSLVETSAITTSVTSASTDAQVPSAKAVYDALQEGGGSSYTAGDGIDITNDVISVTGKVDTSTYETYTAATATAIGDKLAVSDFNTYSGTVDTAINSKASESDLNTLSGTVTAHTANTDIHVTTAQTAAWNAKSDFSGSYNDLTDKPTIPTVPTSNTAFTNDAGYITSSALDGYATTSDVQTATNDMATKTWVGNQGYLTEHQSLSNYYTKSETSGATEISTALNAKADTATTYTKTEVDNAITAATSTKQDTLVSGTNIKTINNESILGSGNITIEGGGGKAVSGGTNISITTGETADTINCTIPAFFHSNTVKGDINIGSNEGVRSDYGRLVIGRRVQSRGNPYFQYSIGIGVQPDNSNNYCQLYGQNSVGIGRGFKIGSDSIYANGINNAVAIGHNATSRNNGDVTLGADTTASGGSSVAIGSGATANGAEYKMNLNNQIKVTPSNQVYIYNKDNTEMICLQDQLGGGGSSYTAGDGIDITNDVISVTGKVDTSAITTSITSSSTDAQVPSAKAVNDKLGGLSLVKLTQSAYDALTTKDSNTLYVIVN